MAESAGEKTEQPTSRRINKARGGGQVVQSQELLSAVTLITLTGISVMMGPRYIQWAMSQMREGFSCNVSHIASSDIFLSFIGSKMVEAMLIMAPFFLALSLASIAANIFVSGWIFTLKPLKWKFGAMNPFKGFKGLVNLDAIVKLLQSVLKIIFVGSLIYFYIQKKIYSLASYQWIHSDQLLGAISHLILGAVMRLCLGLLVMGLVDLFYKKWKYIKDLKMTKQEVKEEHKAQESSPEVKSRIRQKQLEIALKRMLQDVPKASVVLVNPTHVAVALQYDPETMAAPVVLAKGGDHVCEKIKEIARAYGVPIIRRPSLARSIHSSIDIGQPIPDSLFVAVAEVLALIHRLRNRR